jgi:polysaccharide export outer membrane protein
MMKKKILFAFFACVLLFSLQQARCEDESLKIGPGDTVHIKVLETSDLEQVAKVTDAGQVPLVLGGNVTLAGLTPAEAASVIEKALRDGGFVLHPHVTVLIEQYATQNVSVLGQVRSPGTYPIGTPRTVVDVLSLAGGVTELADRKITIERRASGEKISYFLSNQSKTALDDNVKVYPGDIVMVPKADVVYVLGDVGRPGGIVMNTNDSQLSALEAISMAGGTLPHAVPSHTRMVRKQADGTYVEITLPLSDMQKGKKPDVQLQANDIIYVPFSYGRNAALSLGGIVSAAAGSSLYLAR